MLALVTGCWVTSLVIAYAVASTRATRAERRRQARVDALRKLGHDDDDVSTGGWRFKYRDGHIHAIPPEGGDYYGLCSNFDPKTGSYTESSAAWVSADGALVPMVTQDRLRDAFAAWHRMRIISGHARISR